MLIKIKFDIGHGEYRNCWASIRQWYSVKDGCQYYSIHFDDGVSWDNACKFDPSTRAFYGV